MGKKRSLTGFLWDISKDFTIHIIVVIAAFSFLAFMSWFDDERASQKTVDEFLNALKENNQQTIKGLSTNTFEVVFKNTARGLESWEIINPPAYNPFKDKLTYEYIVKITRIIPSGEEVISDYSITVNRKSDNKPWLIKAFSLIKEDEEYEE